MVEINDRIMDDAIGGYFQLELRQGEHYHKDALRLNTARNCFEYILLARKYRKVYIPYYTCEVMLQPLERHHIEYEFYSIDINFEPIETKTLKEGEAFLYTNYYGLKQDYVEKIAEIYGSSLMVDNAQAFYAPRIEGIDTFYSARKYFGVPDGAYLYTDCKLDKKFPKDKSYMRMQHLLQRIDEGAEAGYNAFRVSDDSLDNLPIRAMSELTDAILKNIDYESVAKRRRDNFMSLHYALKTSNKLKIELKTEEIPMAYPFKTDIPNLRKVLIENKIFVAQYWTNVLEMCDDSAIEYRLATHIIPLPIDQRYDVDNMMRVINTI